MDYRLIITEKAEDLLDGLINYLLFRLKNEMAAIHLLDNVDKIYVRLEENPYQFPESKDEYLKRFGYREAVLGDMDYVVVFRIEDHEVFIVGFFHQLEDYRRKMR